MIRISFENIIESVCIIFFFVKNKEKENKKKKDRFLCRGTKQLIHVLTVS